ncbi:MAG: ABC transporter permease [Verrucomicrobiales bacterium]|nr:ABC transporter permease [Verrucomicrobiales bacterium]
MTLAGPGLSRPAERMAFLEGLVERIGVLPGVRSASAADTLPFAGSAWRRVTGASTTKGQSELTPYAAEVGPRYFETLGIPLLRGRSFSQQDNLQSTPVAIVSDTLAQRLFGKTKNPIGQRINVDGEPREIEIIGVVPNIRQAVLGTIRSHTMNLYLSQLQFCGEHAMVATRVEKDPKALVTSIRRTVSELNPDLPLFSVRTMDESIALDQQFFRYLTWCMAVFSVLAVGLAVIGIYGTVGYAAAQRRQEFGVRMALGATAPRILTLVTLQGLRPVAVGLVFGIVTSIWLVRPLIHALFYNVAEAELWMFLAIGFAVTISSGVACMLPAIRGSRVPPMEALRHE